MTEGGNFVIMKIHGIFESVGHDLSKLSTLIDSTILNQVRQHVSLQEEVCKVYRMPGL